jgi:hypothetical protein
MSVKYTGKLIEVIPKEGQTYNMMAKAILKKDGVNLTKSDFQHTHSWSSNHLEYLILEHETTRHIWYNERLYRIEDYNREYTGEFIRQPIYKMFREKDDSIGFEIHLFTDASYWTFSDELCQGMEEHKVHLFRKERITKILE